MNRLLITGTNTAIDTNGKNFKVTLTSNGKVTGFGSFSTFYVNTDFDADPENNIDDLSLDVQTNNQKDVAFKIHRDTIDLYGYTLL